MHVHPIEVTANLDIDPWPDLPRDVRPETVNQGIIERLGLVPANDTGHGCGIVLYVRGIDGRVVLAHTSWSNFLAAAAYLQQTPLAQMDKL